MQTLAGISILWCVLCVGYTYGQDEDFLGIPDFDSYGLDLREDDLLKVTSAEETVGRLCNEYDVFLDNQNLDCNRIKLIQKTLKTEHNLQKRDAEDTQLEGSGDEVENVAPEHSPNEEEAEHPPPPPPPTTELPPNGPPPTQEKPDQSPSKIDAVETDEAGKETDKPEDGAKEGSETDTETTEKPKEPEPPQTATEFPAKEENPTTPETERETEVETDVKEVTESAAAREEDKVEPHVTEPEAQEATEKPVDKDQSPTIASVSGRNVEAKKSDPDTDKTEGKTDGEQKEEEKMNEHQSNNAIVEGASGATMEQVENGIKSMAPNAKIHEGEPKHGESTEETEGSRKDTKILIILFVAVVVIGTAAFAYNFIKKRKQKKAQMSGTENGDSNIKVRSLQNLSGQAKSDPENGTELKPLMKTTEPKPVVAEFKDEKNKQ